MLSIARRQGVLSLDITSDQLPRRVRRTLEESGGIFVKLGQVASTRSDVLPLRWCNELSHLRSNAEPQPVDVVRERLTAELGADPDAVFATFDWEPLASASIAQVHRATLDSGDEVVVKVQRTGLDETLERDSAAIRQMANLIQRRTSLGLAVHPAELADEFLEGVAEELDFDIEANNARELAAGLATIDRIRVPHIHESLSTNACSPRSTCRPRTSGTSQRSRRPVSSRRDRRPVDRRIPAPDLRSRCVPRRSASRATSSSSATAPSC